MKQLMSMTNLIADLKTQLAAGYGINNKNAKALLDYVEKLEAVRQASIEWKEAWELGEGFGPQREVLFKALKELENDAR